MTYLGKHHLLGRIIKCEDNIMMNIYRECPCDLYFTHSVRITFYDFNERANKPFFVFDLVHLFVCFLDMQVAEEVNIFNIARIAKSTKTNDNHLVIKHTEKKKSPRLELSYRGWIMKVAIEDPPVIS